VYSVRRQKMPVAFYMLIYVSLTHLDYGARFLQQFLFAKNLIKRGTFTIVA